MVLRRINKQPLTFPIKACVAFLPPQSRLTCNQYAVCPLQSFLSKVEINSFVNVNAFSRLHRTVHFRSAPLNLPDTFKMPFLPSLNTITFNYRICKRFISSSRKAIMRELPLYIIKRWKELLHPLHSWHTQPSVGHFIQSAMLLNAA